MVAVGTGEGAVHVMKFQYDSEAVDYPPELKHLFSNQLTESPKPNIKYGIEFIYYDEVHQEFLVTTE